MDFLLSLIIGKWAKYFWPFLLCLAVFLYWNNLNSKIQDLKQDKRELKAAIAVHVENEKKLKFEITQQNDAILELHKQYNSLSKQSIELAKEANDTNNALNKKLTNQIELIRSITTPKDCQSAIDLLIDVAIQNKWPTNKQEETK